jgi:ribA/ribD-fused uncharacterized protein
MTYAHAAPAKNSKNVMGSKNKNYPLEKFYIYFSPYTAHAILVDGVIYATVEHAYQCQRYTDQKIIEEIRAATSPVKAWETSTKYKHLQIPEFKDENHKLEVMKKLMRLKALQHEEIKKALLDSEDMKIVKHIVTYPPGDGFWDDGEDGAGLNHMGRMWMEIREELK